MKLNLVYAFAAFLSVTEAAIRNRCNSNGVVALSFDDGPSDNTNQLLNILDQKNAKVTFHLTTQYLTDPNVQEMIQRIASAGHLIGLRTEPSWNLFQMTDDSIKASIARQSQVMAEFIGYQPILIRLPYKQYDDRVLAAIESTGAIVSVHNLETYDYTQDANRIMKAYQVTLNLAGKGNGNFISVQHDGVAPSVAVTPKIIDYIRSMDYKIIKLDECLGLGDLTKNKKALDGGKGEAAPMEIDSSDSGSLPLPGSGSGKKGKTFNGGKGGKSKVASTSAASSIVAPFAYSALAAAMASLFFF